MAKKQSKLMDGVVGLIEYQGQVEAATEACKVEESRIAETELRVKVGAASDYDPWKYLSAGGVLHSGVIARQDTDPVIQDRGDYTRRDMLENWLDADGSFVSEVRVERDVSGVSTVTATIIVPNRQTATATTIGLPSIYGGAILQQPWYGQEVNDMDMLTALRSFDPDTIDIPNAIALAAFGDQLLAGYTSRGIPAPDWLTENLEKLNTEVARRQRDELERALKSARLKVEGLKSAEEKRNDALAEIDRLTAALAGLK